MLHRTRTLAVLLSSAALAGAGAPAAAEAHHGGGDHHGAGHHGFRRGHDRGLARTAAQLGVTQDQLKAALKTVADQQKAAAAPPSLESLVASQLGVTEDQLKTAFERTRSRRRSTATAASSTTRPRRCPARRW